MKAILTFLFIIVLSTSAVANTSTRVNKFNPKIETYEQVGTSKMDTLLDSSVVFTSSFKEVNIANEKSVARLYKFKNSRIKKALSFTTKRNKAQKA